MKTNKIIVIGGSGFVGTFLVDKIIKEHQVKIFDKEQSSFFSEITKVGDIRNLKQLEKNVEGQDTVVLLAAEHKDNVKPTSLYYDVNVQGTKNVLDAMDKLKVKNLIFTSSVAIYGLNKENPDEIHKEDPFNHYGKSKWQAEKLIKQWYENDPNEKSVTIIRPTVIFGERNRGNVYNLLKQISSGKFMIVGSGQNKKSMAYVGNVVAFINKFLNKTDPGYQIFNYSDKPDYSMAELVSIIESKMKISINKLRIPYWIGMIGGYFIDILSLITRKKFPISSIRIKKFCATTQFNSNKAHANFRAPYTLKQGLDKTLEYEFLNSRKDEILFYSE